MTEQRKAVIKNADMSEEMQQDAVDIASQALAKYNIEKVRICLFLRPLFCKRRKICQTPSTTVEKKRLKR